MLHTKKCTVKNFNQIPEHILNHFFLVLEKPISHWGNLFAQPRNDFFLFPSWNFPPKGAIQEIQRKHIPPARKSLVNDILAGSRERDRGFFDSVAFNNGFYFREVLLLHSKQLFQKFGILKYFHFHVFGPLPAMQCMVFLGDPKELTLLCYFSCIL